MDRGSERPLSHEAGAHCLPALRSVHEVMANTWEPWEQSINTQQGRASGGHDTKHGAVCGHLLMPQVFSATPVRASPSPTGRSAVSSPPVAARFNTTGNSRA